MGLAVALSEEALASGVQDPSRRRLRFSQAKAVFEAYGSVPTKGRINTECYALGAVFVYQPAVLRRRRQEMQINLGLKASQPLEDYYDQTPLGSFLLGMECSTMFHGYSQAG